jgi:hypothetical protein
MTNSTPPFGYSVPEFRQLHGYGTGSWKTLQKLGLAPRITLMPGTQFARITAADYEDWLKRISDPDCQLQEWQRRRERYSAQGRAASLSPTHPAQMWKRFRKLGISKSRKPAPKRQLGRPAGRPPKMQAAE